MTFMVSFGENHCQLIDINTSEKKNKRNSFSNRGRKELKEVNFY